MIERVLAHFEEQARICVEYGSPFTGELIARAAEDIAAGGPVAALVRDWPTNPRADALSLRFAGALHAATLAGRDPALAALYPAQNPNWRMDEVWPAARAFVAREPAWVGAFLQSAPQTNEVRRSIALAAGFLHFAQNWNGPIDTLELGASAGLNVNWDNFHYRTASWSWGHAQSPVTIDTEWSGPAPPLPRVHVRTRAACDLNPLDIRDPAQLLQLKAYIWPDQPERLARFVGAAALAAGVVVDRADAAEWLARKLAARAHDAATIVYHSVFLQYPPKDARAAIIAAMHAAGAAATEAVPLAWVRLEPDMITEGVSQGSRFVVDLTTWPGGARRVIGYTDGHVRSFDSI